MAKIANGQVMDILTLSKIDAEIGDYQWSHLDEALINAEKLGVWYPVDGRSSVGTAFQALTGQATVPNALDEGTFLRQAKEGRELGTYEADQIEDHKHDIYLRTINQALGPAVQGGGSDHWQDSRNSYSILGANDANVGDETRSKNIALNLYVKVDY